VLRHGGSSALRLDPEEQGDVIAAFHACCATEVKALDGMIAPYLGYGVLAYFGYPTAPENDAERAVLAGLAVRDWPKEVCGRSQCNP
jgi:class 3 adenylate cyclase